METQTEPLETLTEPRGPLHLRRATPADAHGIAQVHVRSWRDAHRGLVPQDVLDAITVAQREAFWATEMSVLPPERQPWIAEIDGRIVGFATAGISRDDGAPAGTGEFYALYVDPDCWGMGIGRSLLEHVTRDLRARGFDVVTFWVLGSLRRARIYFEALGWAPDGATRLESFGRVQLEEVRYRRELRP